MIDHSVFSHTATVTEVEKPSSTFFSMIREYASVSDALRLLGALAVAVSMGIFLIDGFAVKNDIYRFITMLGLTTLLTVTGLIMSMFLKEQRGSRVFIGLGLLSVPVNFTVFSALIYSILPLDSGSADYPSYAYWQASLSDIPVALASGAVVLLPVIWLGFTVLARSARSWLSTAIIVSSLLLLVPVRGELASSLLAIVATASMMWFCRKYSRNSMALKTLEGRFCVALVYAAPTIMVVRGLFLYEVAGVLLLALAAGIYLFTRTFWSGHHVGNLSGAAATFVSAFAAVVIGMSASEVLSAYLDASWAIVVSALAVLVLAFDIQNNAPRGDMNKLAVGALGLIATAALVFLAAFGINTLAITGVSIMIVLALGLYGYVSRQWLLAGVGTTGGFVAIATNGEALWLTIEQTGWWGVAAIGMAAIVAGSMLDRAGTFVKVVKKAAD